MNSPPGILIIDDDPGRRRALHRDMLVSGFNVADSEFPDAAIALARILRIEIVILNLPVHDRGVKTCQAVRAGIPYAALVVLTSCCDPCVVAEILDAGADQCLAHPLDLREFLAHIRAVARVSEQRRDAPDAQPVRSPAAPDAPCEHACPALDTVTHCLGNRRFRARRVSAYSHGATAHETE